ncbi:MAG: Spy/CpxP family protein refolding chaperone [Acidobacteriota bacterium]
MRLKAVWVVLAASVCFNVFFAIGFLRARAVIRKMETPEGRAEIVAERLSLSPQQRLQYDAMRSAINAILAANRKINGAHMNTFWSEVIRDHPDSAILSSAIEAALEGQKAARVQMAEQVKHFMTALTPAQREAFVHIVRQRDLAP